LGNFGFFFTWQKRFERFESLALGFESFSLPQNLPKHSKSRISILDLSYQVLLVRFIVYHKYFCLSSRLLHFELCLLICEIARSRRLLSMITNSNTLISVFRNLCSAPSTPAPASIFIHSAIDQKYLAASYLSTPQAPKYARSTKREREREREREE
jgi:hypothetical protein